MRAHFQKQAYEKRQMEVESLVKPKSDMSLVLDARAVFLPRTFFRNPDKVDHSPLARLGRVRPGRVMMKHSFEVGHGATSWDRFDSPRSGRSGRREASSGQECILHGSISLARRSEVL